MATVLDTSTYLEVTVPVPQPLAVPVFTGLTPPTPPERAEVPVTQYAYRAYGSLIRDYLEGEISDLSQFFTSLDALAQELWLLQLPIFRKYHTARREYLSAEGKRSPAGLPGHVSRRLAEMAVEEAREISETALKLTAQKIEESRGGVGWALERSVASDALRFDQHHRLQSANFEVASAMIDAAYKTAVQNIERYNQGLALVSLSWEEVKSEVMWQSQQVALYVDQIKGVGAVVQNEGELNKLVTVAAELDAIAARRAALSYELQLLAAEVVKNNAQLELARAEALVASAKEVTASLEMTKAVARRGLATNAYQRNDLAIERTHVELTRAEASAAMQRAELGLSVKEHELALIRDQYDVKQKEFQAELAAIRLAYPALEEVMNRLRVAITSENSALEVAAIAREAMVRSSNTLSVATSRAAVVPALAAHAGMAGTIIFQAANQRVQAMVEAANSAANANVTSEFYYE